MEGRSNYDLNITKPNTYILYPYTTAFYLDFNYSHKIRLYIFFISAVCVGAPCLIWVFYLVHLQRKTRHRISAFIILLLIIDLLQLVLYPYIVSELFPLNLLDGFVFIELGYFGLKMCGLHLQQLVALEGVLTLKYPHLSAHIFSLPCYIIISIIILLFPLMCILLRGFGEHKGLYLAFGSVLAPVCLLVVTGIITYKTPPTPATTSTKHRADRFIFVVSMITTTVLYLPCAVYFCMQFFQYPISKSWFVMFNCLLSFTVVSEPFLCMLVCRENLRTQREQTHREFNCEQTSV